MFSLHLATPSSCPSPLSSLLFDRRSLIMVFLFLLFQAFSSLPFLAISLEMLLSKGSLLITAGCLSACGSSLLAKVHSLSSPEQGSLPVWPSLRSKPVSLNVFIIHVDVKNANNCANQRWKNRQIQANKCTNTRRKICIGTHRKHVTFPPSAERKNPP